MYRRCEAWSHLTLFMVDEVGKPYRHSSSAKRIDSLNNGSCVLSEKYTVHFPRAIIDAYIAQPRLDFRRKWSTRVMLPRVSNRRRYGTGSAAHQSHVHILKQRTALKRTRFTPCVDVHDVHEIEGLDHISRMKREFDVQLIGVFFLFLLRCRMECPVVGIDAVTLVHIDTRTQLIRFVSTRQDLSSDHHVCFDTSVPRTIVLGSVK